MIIIMIMIMNHDQHYRAHYDDILVPKSTELAHGVLGPQPILSLLPVAVISLVLVVVVITMIMKCKIGKSPKMHFTYISNGPV